MCQLQKRVCSLFYFPFFSLWLFIGGCSTSPLSVLGTDSQLIFSDTKPQEHLDQEVVIAKLSQVLQLEKMTREDRAAFYFERGVLYDSLGLWTLSRFDFSQAIQLKPKMADAYNYLGIYALIEGDYDAAIDYFNAVLTLDPNYSYAFFNRGLSFYYSNRYTEAEDDFLKFYQEETANPYRVLWLYFNEVKQNPNQALALLKQRSTKLSNEYWGTNIVQYYLDEISLTELQQRVKQYAEKSQSQYAEVLTETYFYLAKQQLMLHNKQDAITLFKLAMVNQVYSFVEYRFALLELLRLSETKVRPQSQP
ncbi:lipoprotein NlpI-like protein [Gallibacterium salpingitidis]|uniref:Lipoprotein NlpI n=1 Tax=Gallibacterium salpingitidis TaxID=505341 RepID=A0AB36E5Q5_9PAST|nr:lipoprotein NlpI [Gallibacterium salpingitidis]OBX07126.1 lipoprotein NlpI-like protein [Gallibacterium salpingitidis]OBX12095.1 lipoprotein NlpI-like protein [Gallibacterium salpingitidis]